MNWIDILKKRKWQGTLSSKKKEMLERSPKIKIDIPKLSYPKEETEIPTILRIMKDKTLTPKQMKDADLKPEKEMFRIVDADREDYEDLIKDINYEFSQSKNIYNNYYKSLYNNLYAGTATLNYFFPILREFYLLIGTLLIYLFQRSYEYRVFV